MTRCAFVSSPRSFPGFLPPLSLFFFVVLVAVFSLFLGFALFLLLCAVLLPFLSFCPCSLLFPPPPLSLFDVLHLLCHLLFSLKIL